MSGESPRDPTAGSSPERLAELAIERGERLREVGRSEEALAAFQDATRLDPTRSYPIARSAILLAQLGERRRAREAGALAVATAPDNWFTHFAMASVEAQRGRPRRAVKAAREAARLAPQEPGAAWMLAATLLDAGRKKEALREAERFVRLAPESPDARSLLGRALLVNRRQAEAERATRESLELAPSSSEPHFALGLALLAQGKTDDAIPHFHEAARLEPDETAYRRGLLEALREHLREGSDLGRLYWLGCALANPIGLVVVACWVLASPVLLVRTHLRLRRLPPVVREVWGAHLARKRRRRLGAFLAVLGLPAIRLPALALERPLPYDSIVDLLCVMLGATLVAVAALILSRRNASDAARGVAIGAAVLGLAAVARTVWLISRSVGPFSSPYEAAITVVAPVLLIGGVTLFRRA